MPLPRKDVLFGSTKKYRLLDLVVGFVFGFCVAYTALNVTTIVRLKPVRSDEYKCNKPLKLETSIQKTEYKKDGINQLNRLSKEDQEAGIRKVLELSKGIRHFLNHTRNISNAEVQLRNRLTSFERALGTLSSHTTVSVSTSSTFLQGKYVLVQDEQLHKDNYTVADTLYRKVRVLCWVMTQPSNLETRARHVKNTWGKRCHKLLFFSSVANATFPTIALNMSFEARSQLNKKTIAAFQYVYEHYWSEYDWFMRTDDDAYLIMENLRYFLSEQDPNGIYYFGHHFKTIVPGGYFSGGPGIVLGKEALRRYAAASKNSSMCFQGESFADDAMLGDCLHKVGIKPGNSTDRLGRSRFHCFNPGTHLMKIYPDWFYAYDANGAHGGQASMSDYAIGFHYVNDAKINELEYFVYHLRPYGVKFSDQDLNQKQTL